MVQGHTHAQMWQPWREFLFPSPLSVLPLWPRDRRELWGLLHTFWCYDSLFLGGVLVLGYATLLTAVTDGGVDYCTSTV